MTRYKICIEYDGSHLFGWQKQHNLVSVQGAIEGAITEFTRNAVEVRCAGRTDAGVHAVGQVAHFDLIDIKMSDISILNAINFHIRPLPITVTSLEKTAEDWHARFLAKNKVYLYRVINRRAGLALEKNRALHVPHPLNIDAMRAAGQALIGKHDFSSFRSTECQAKNPIRTLNSCEIREDGDLIEIEFQAKSFLHHQVRIMVGSLLAVGAGKENNISDILESRDRRRAHKTVAACGLYLMRVDY